MQKIENSNRKKAIAGFGWRLLEKLGAQLVTVVVGIVLARLLEPSLYGKIALVTVFTSILTIFVDGGLGNALVQKKDADDIDFSSVFYFNITICLILYGIMYLIAPIIANWYEDVELIEVIRVLSVTLIIYSVKNVQQAYVSRNLLFKRFFYSTLCGTIISAVVGIYMAYNGYGIWALVAQSVINPAIDTLVLWMTVPWRPKKTFSFVRLKGLLNFGWKFVVSALVDTVYNNVNQLIIGKIYKEEDLAFYNKGKQFPNMLIVSVDSSLNSVLLPVMSQGQDDKDRVKSIARRAIKTSTYFIMPLMVGLFCVAELFVKVLLGEKWMMMVPFLRIFCLIYMFWPIHSSNLNAINALGRSDIYLKLEIVKKAIGLVIIIVTARLGVMAIAVGSLCASLLSIIVNSYPNGKLISYGLCNQIRDVIANLIISIMMGLIVWLVYISGISDALMLIIKVIVGIVAYVTLSLLIKNETMVWMLNVIKRR